MILFLFSSVFVYYKSKKITMVVMDAKYAFTSIKFMFIK